MILMRSHSFRVGSRGHKSGLLESILIFDVQLNFSRSVVG